MLPYEDVNFAYEKRQDIHKLHYWIILSIVLNLI